MSAGTPSIPSASGSGPAASSSSPSTTPVPTPASSVAALPASLRANPRLGAWLQFDADGTLLVQSGKVEIGQGILTALAQVVADELDWPIQRLRVTATRTGVHPDEGVTSGSLSLQESGSALRHVCRQLRAAARAEAARRWSCSPMQVHDSGGVLHGPDARTLALAELAGAGLLDAEASALETTGTAPAIEGGLVGRPVPRLDLPDKVWGRPRFIHDLCPAALLHGRVLRPPNAASGVAAADLDDARAVDGVVLVLQDGRQFGVLAASSAAADAALARLSEGVRWSVPDALPDESALDAWLREAPVETTVIADRGGAGPPEPGERGLRASYSRPFLAHASLGPACALARWDDARLSVWSHTQGVYNLRRDLALAFGCPSHDVVVQHVEGAGCYGHNGADDVAWDAAWLARQVPGRTVRVLWTRAGELGDAPFGPAGVVDLQARLDAQGRVTHWHHEVWSPGHSSRPGRAAVPTLLGAGYTARPFERLPAINVGAAMGGGADRNAVPGYAFEAVRVVSHRVLDASLRSSALRSLGALLNVFAAESFIDELAAAAGSDPVSFRLRHLDDPRGRAVIERAVAGAGWQPGTRAGDDQGWGLGYARYKGSGAWCAVVARVHAGERLRVLRLTIAADLGRVVNPDGAASQLEGGAIQATSMTLKEAVRFDRRRITSTDWEQYPILRFSEVPAVDVLLADGRDPSLGAGEASFGPTAAAIGNALFDATGLRMRSLPFTPDRLRAAIEAA